MKIKDTKKKRGSFNVVDEKYFCFMFFEKGKLTSDLERLLCRNMLLKLNRLML